MTTRPKARFLSAAKTKKRALSSLFLSPTQNWHSTCIRLSTQHEVPPVFGDLGTGRPGIPLFYSAVSHRNAYSAVRLTSSRHRPPSAAPCHWARGGRAATRLSNIPPLLRRTRQLTALPSNYSWT